MTDTRPARRYRFGVFEADSTTGELRRKGVRIKLHSQPFQVLHAQSQPPFPQAGRNTLQRRLDLRIHFGLDQAKKADVEIRWPSGQTDSLKDLDANRLYVIQEGGKILKSGSLHAMKTPAKAKA